MDGSGDGLKQTNIIGSDEADAMGQNRVPLQCRFESSSGIVRRRFTNRAGNEGRNIDPAKLNLGCQAVRLTRGRETITGHYLSSQNVNSTN